MSRRGHGTGSITARGAGRWLVRIRLGIDATTGRDERVNFTVSGTKGQAERALREALAKLDHGVDLRPDQITVSDWLPRWLERHRAEGRIGESTYRRYEIIIRCHLLPVIGRARLVDLRPDHISDLKAGWLAKIESSGKQPLSASTVHQHLVVLQQALNEAARSGLIPKNPATHVRGPTIRRDKEKRALTDDEIALLLKSSSGTRVDTPIRVALATGLREGELLALLWEDLDFEAAVLRVRRGKTANSRRTIELSAATAELLRGHRLEQAERRLRCGGAWSDSGRIFASSIGTAWSVRNFYRDYRKVVMRSGLPDPAVVDFHCLRHTAATQWIRQGVDVFTVSRRLGHASAAFTMDVYGHPTTGQQRQAAAAFDHLIARAR